MTNLRADSSVAELPLFQGEDGGAIPTSALQLLFRPIEHITAMIAYNNWHYLGNTDFISQTNFGCYWNGLLHGAISYGPPNATDLKGYWDRNSQAGWMEIKRLVMSPICPKNSESRFIGYTIKKLRKFTNLNGIVTYADSQQGHIGTIYKASGFKYLGLTKKKMDFWIDGRIQQRGKTSGIDGKWVERSQKHLFIKDFRNNKTKGEQPCH
jgi:hypothetical protein